MFLSIVCHTNLTTKNCTNLLILPMHLASQYVMCSTQRAKLQGNVTWSCHSLQLSWIIFPRGEICGKPLEKWNGSWSRWPNLLSTVLPYFLSKTFHRESFPTLRVFACASAHNAVKAASSKITCRDFKRIQKWRLKLYPKQKEQKKAYTTLVDDRRTADLALHHEIEPCWVTSSWYGRC